MEWWMWLTAGLLLVGLEVVTPTGFYLMFFGLGALTIGVLTRLHVFETAWIEWLLFTVISLSYVLIFRRRLQRRVGSQPAPVVDSLVGDLAIPRERIPPGGTGRVEVRGASWTARNEAASTVEPGQRCRVSGVDGLTLFVQPE